MACCEDKVDKLADSTNVVEKQNAPVQHEYDIVEQPSQHFFCPVTRELLTEPHQTTCCGNHLSQEAANRLRRDGKPCPMCKEPQLSTIPDKFYKRKVNELKVRCPHKKSDCEWVGEVSEVKQHSQSCPKRPWQCQYCPFASTYDIGVSKHVPKCSQYPVVCPNYCEIGSVPRCEVEAHLTVCPLEPVACEYAEVGCDVKIPRRDLARHMEEGQQQHLLSATLLNLRLTRENLAEKDRVIAERDRQLVEKEHVIANKSLELADKVQQIAEVKRQLTEMKCQIADLQEMLKTQQEGLEMKIASLQLPLEMLDLKFIKSSSALYNYYTSLGFTCHKFVVREFSKMKAGGKIWSSGIFSDSHPGGYKLDLYVVLNGEGDVRATHLSVLLALLPGDSLSWPVECTLHMQVINQLGGDHDHHVASGSMRFVAGSSFKTGIVPNLISRSELDYNAARNTQYLKDDCIHLQVYIKCSKCD